MTQSGFDTAVWRVKGDPLVAGSGRGALKGQTVAVKDLFAVAGQPIGAGSPARLSGAHPARKNAWAVAALLAAGADITGISQTDEFALSLAGTNAHYGTPPNPAAPGRISGGSSNGSASAVALGEVAIGLGTDTGGSIRVPSAYQGLWGIRTTHDLIPRTGVHPLADSFDTIGWMTRTPDLLAQVAEVLIPKPKFSAPSAPSAMGGMGTTGSIPVVPRGPVAWDSGHQLGELKIIEALFALADAEVAEACRRVLAGLEALTDGSAVVIPGPEQGVLPRWKQTFSTIQLSEAWAQHGGWVSEHWEDMAPDVGSRFRAASELTLEDETQARELRSAIRETIRSWVGDGVLALPSAASVAPLAEDVGVGTAEADDLRQRTLMLTTLAPLAGLPVVSIPATTADGLPAGLSLMGPSGSDKALIAYASRLAAESA